MKRNIKTKWVFQMEIKTLSSSNTEDSYRDFSGMHNPDLNNKIDTAFQTQVASIFVSSLSGVIGSAAGFSLLIDVNDPDTAVTKAVFISFISLCILGLLVTTCATLKMNEHVNKLEILSNTALIRYYQQELYEFNTCYAKKLSLQQADQTPPVEEELSYQEALGPRVSEEYIQKLINEAKGTAVNDLTLQAGEYIQLAPPQPTKEEKEIDEEIKPDMTFAWDDALPVYVEMNGMLA